MRFLLRIEYWTFLFLSVCIGTLLYSTHATADTFGDQHSEITTAHRVGSALTTVEVVALLTLEKATECIDTGLLSDEEMEYWMWRETHQRYTIRGAILDALVIISSDEESMTLFTERIESRIDLSLTSLAKGLLYFTFSPYNNCTYFK